MAAPARTVRFISGLTVSAALLLGGTSAAHADIFWINQPDPQPTEKAVSTYTIAKASNDGSTVNQSLIDGGSNVWLTGITATASNLYFTKIDLTKPENSIQRAALTGGTTTTVITSPANQYLVGLASTSTSLFWNTYDPFGTPVSPIGTSALDGSGANPALVGTKSGNTVASDGTYVYWSNVNDPNGQLGDWHTIGRAKIDGSDATQSFIETGSSSLGIVINGEYIYWTNSGNVDPNGGTIPTPGTSIGRAKVDGTQIDQDFITGADSPQGLGTDGTYLYWSNYLSNTIGRAKLDGTEVKQDFLPASNPGPLTVSKPPTPTPTPTPTTKKSQKPDKRSKLPTRIATDGVTMLTPNNPRTNAGQRIRTLVRCTPVLAAANGEKRYCQVKRNARGMVMLRTFGQSVRVVVIQTAAPDATHKRYFARTVYVSGQKR